MQDGQARHRPGERHVQPLQAPGLGAGDPGGLDHDDVIEFESLGQRDRHQREPGVRAGFAILKLRALERAGQGPDTGSAAMIATDPGLVRA